MELYKQFKDSHGVYIPVERERRIDKKTKEVSVIERPAMYGLVFAPLSRHKDFRRRVPGRYFLRQLFFEPSMNPRTVELSELVRMQEILNAEFAGGLAPVAEPADEVWFDVGDKVDLSGCLLPGVVGIIQRIKSDGTVRVQLGGGMQYLQVKKQQLRKM
jgi:hypothetical protein